MSNLCVVSLITKESEVSVVKNYFEMFLTSITHCAVIFSDWVALSNGVHAVTSSVAGLGRTPVPPSLNLPISTMLNL